MQNHLVPFLHSGEQAPFGNENDQANKLRMENLTVVKHVVSGSGISVQGLGRRTWHVGLGVSDFGCRW